MHGLMMDYPLTLQHFMDRAHLLYPTKEIATKQGANMHRYTYADWYARTNKLASALKRLGVQKSERIGTFAWNTYRHLELYFGVSCSGAVTHTLNLRLPPDQLVYIANHAEDSIVFVDASLVPLLEKVASQLETVKQYVVMCDAELPQTSLKNAVSYEELIAPESDSYAWPTLDEHDAAFMCYTSGTTGHPKGALYSHRALFLHSYGEGLASGMAITENDVVMPVVPMFHANAWGLAFTATMVGAKQVFPGPHLQPVDLLQLIQKERVTVPAGVPSIWIGILAELERNPNYDVSSIRAMPVGGSAAPRSMIESFEKKFGVSILHAWGMTEMSPVGTLSILKSHMKDWPEDKKFAVRAKQGTPVAGVEIRGVDETGNPVPWDGKTMGELEVRGPWIISAYYKLEASQDRFHDGWFRTGDVVTIDPEGYIQIIDRTKDLVRSGGEWISTVDLEGLIMGHPKVLEAAVIAVAHPKWGERPLALVVPKPEWTAQLTKQEIFDFLAPKTAKWWLPDDVVFIEAVPKTSVGKFDKKVLRKEFKDYHLPTAGNLE
jgi:fatty-acyl-CoA synthase